MDSYYDSFDLAMKLFGLDPDSDEDYEKAEEELGEMLYDKYEITSEGFESLIKDLLPFAHLEKSALNDDLRAGFCDHKNGVYLIMERIKNS